MNHELIIKLFREKLVLNQIYSRIELDDLIQKNLGISINITALTYNRWNEGMNETLCLFEYVDRAKYKFIDTEEISKFTGQVSHFPQGDGKEYLIGNFKKGKMNYLNGVLNFKEWKKTKDTGARIISEGTKFEVEKEGQFFKFYISDGITKDFKDGYGSIGINSALGREFIGKKVDTIINFNSNKYFIKKII
jgi:hypothetical protein